MSVVYCTATDYLWIEIVYQRYSFFDSTLLDRLADHHSLLDFIKPNVGLIKRTNDANINQNQRIDIIRVCCCSTTPAVALLLLRRQRSLLLVVVVVVVVVQLLCWWFNVRSVPDSTANFAAASL
jgi:hypothetical protein